jgi:hypothetical protein
VSKERKAMNEEDLMRRGDHLAQRCAMDKVPENQLGMVLAHLKRHRRPEATRQLLEELKRSPFAFRNKGTRLQFENLERHVKAALSHVSDGHEAAVIVGWGKRLWPVYKQRSH